MKKTQHIDFEGNFGSQDPALQPTAEDFAIISHYIKEQKQRRAQEAAAKQQPRPQQKEAA